MDNRMNKVQYNDCVLYITDRDLNDVLLNGPAYPVVQKPYLEVQMENWYSADFPEGVEDVGQMLTSCATSCSTCRRRCVTAATRTFTTWCQQCG